MIGWGLSIKKRSGLTARDTVKIRVCAAGRLAPAKAEVAEAEEALKTLFGSGL